jgi:SAM-dependent methyltransferase
MTDDVVQKLKNLLVECFQNETLRLATLSSPRNKELKVLKTAIRPVLIKGKLQYQMSRFTKEQAFHENLAKEHCCTLLQELIFSQYKQCTLQTENCDYHILVGNNHNLKIIEKPAANQLAITSHNRSKKYFFKENVPIPFLVKLGIMNHQGKVVAGKRDKFKQINKFLEIISGVLPAFKDKKELRILDFGCGKAYLTFALYYYLHDCLNYEPEIVGIDLKKEVLATCQEIAKELGYTNLHFIPGDINTYNPQNKIDLVAALHACDTATDDALGKAVDWEARVILSVPCCQHELFSQVQNVSLKPFLKHGILKEKFCALATDAARGLLLESFGYKVDIVEFIDPEHTPKNILIRAVLKSKKSRTKKLSEEYTQFKKFLNIYPSLEKHFL